MKPVTVLNEDWLLLKEVTAQENRIVQSKAQQKKNTK